MSQVDTRELYGRLAKKLLMPLVASTVTAAASYAGKKAPELLEEKLMPKLREATAATSSGPTKPVPTKNAAPGAPAAAHHEVETEDEAPAANGGRSSTQIERRREERAAHREARRNRKRS